MVYRQTDRQTDDSITKDTNTHLEYIIFIAFPRQQWFRARPKSYVYTYIDSYFLKLILWIVTKMRPQNTDFRDCQWRREVYTSWLFLLRLTSTRTVHVGIVSGFAI
jgi:hypothetical protein